MSDNLDNAIEIQESKASKSVTEDSDVIIQTFEPFWHKEYEEWKKVHYKECDYLKSYKLAMEDGIYEIIGEDNKSERIKAENVKEAISKATIKPIKKIMYVSNPKTIFLLASMLELNGTTT